jgi:Pseudouridylate synthases, 23S RNA-specific
MKQYIATPNDADQTARKFLQKAAPLLPGTMLYKAFRKKRVKVGGKAVGVDYVIKLGDIIELYVNDEFFPETKRYKPPEEKIDLDIVHETEELLIVNKPAGLLSHPDLINGIIAYLIEKGEYNPEGENTFTPALCNRLDRNTSGLLIAAKTAEALRKTNEQIKNREIKKFYLAKHSGTLPADEGTLSHHHLKDEKQNKAIIKDGPFENSKQATIHYKRLGDGLAEIELITGRFHQIRAQLAHIGCPLIGDRKYGGAKGTSNGIYSLTAYKLILPDGTIITNE